jgi:hypothetical protein
VVEAKRARKDSIHRATRALEPLLVDRQMIAVLLEDHIVETGKRMRGVLQK